jgi:hypothetical protein
MCSEITGNIDVDVRYIKVFRLKNISGETPLPIFISSLLGEKGHKPRMRTTQFTAVLMEWHQDKNLGYEPKVGLLRK